VIFCNLNFVYWFYGNSESLSSKPINSVFLLDFVQFCTSLYPFLTIHALTWPADTVECTHWPDQLALSTSLWTPWPADTVECTRWPDQLALSTSLWTAFHCHTCLMQLTFRPKLRKNLVEPRSNEKASVRVTRGAIPVYGQCDANSPFSRFLIVTWLDTTLSVRAL